MKIEALKGIDKLKDISEDVLKQIISLHEKSSAIEIEKAEKATETALTDNINEQLSNIDKSFSLNSLDKIGSSLKGLGEASTKLVDLQKKYDDLKKKGSSDEVIKKENGELKDQLKVLKTKHTDYVTTSEKALLDKDTDFAEKLQKSELSNALVGITFRKDIADLVDDKVGIAKDTFLKSYKKETRAGKEVYVNENGEVQVNEKTFEPLTAKELMLPLLGSIVDNGKGGKGSGTETDDTISYEGIDISGAKTKDDAFNAYSSGLVSSGVAKGSNEYGAKLDEFIKSDDYAALT